MRYYFNVVDGTRYTDPLGRELASDEIAIAEARSALRHLVQTARMEADLQVIVVDQEGRTVATVWATELVAK